MAKSRAGKGTENSGKKEYIESVVAAAKEKKEKSEAERKEAAQKEIMAAMNEEEKKLFMSQEEILDREKAAASREEALKKEWEELEKKREEVSLNHQREEERLKKEREELEQQKLEQAKQDRLRSEREKSISAEEKKLDHDRKMLDKRQSSLNNQERDLIERENNAEAGFTAQNQRSLEALRKAQEELIREIDTLQEKKISAQTDLQAEMQNIRKQKLTQMEAEMEDYRKSVVAEIDTEVKTIKESAEVALQRERELVEATRHALEQERQEINEQKNQQNKSLRQIADASADLEARETMLREERAEFESKVSGEVERRINNALFEMKQKEQDIERLKDRLKNAQDQIAKFKERERAADGSSADELIERIRMLEDENSELTQEIARIPKDDQLAAYQTKAEKYDKTIRELETAKRELEELKREMERHMQFEVKLADAKQEADYYKRMVEVKQLMLQKYSEEVDKFRSLYQQPKELESRLDAIFEHEFEPMGFADNSDISELEWLNNIFSACVNCGVTFNKRLLKSFHTSLKTAEWSPVTVLAGVSGTGKSLLPEYYCRFGGIYFKPMAVQPDWDSPQSLFGFFNSIDNRFNATTLIRAMVQFADFKSLQKNVQKILREARNEDEVSAYLQRLEVEKYNLHDAMFMVLLDEMNLAHVELYFSDMLSKLERRRNSDERINVEIDMGAGMSKFPLELTDNVLWVGTMNEDETTKSLSDKVLDRGNLISFPRPTEFKSRKKINYMPAVPMLRRSLWDSWVNANVIENEDFSLRVEKYRNCLQEVNACMGHAGRALGHRVWQSIENYMANHPDVISAFSAKQKDAKRCEQSMQRAFEDALVYKVMPKLRGMETDGNFEAECFNPMREALFEKEGLAIGIEKDFKNALNNPYKTFLWCSAEYLDMEE